MHIYNQVKGNFGQTQGVAHVSAVLRTCENGKKVKKLICLKMTQIQKPFFCIWFCLFIFSNFFFTCNEGIIWRLFKNPLLWVSAKAQMFEKLKSCISLTIWDTSGKLLSIKNGREKILSQQSKWCRHLSSLRQGGNAGSWAPETGANFSGDLKCRKTKLIDGCGHWATTLC